MGPGHAGIYRHDDGRYYFSHHFYDAANGGTPSLALWHLTWVDGWPQIVQAARSTYSISHFQIGAIAWKWCIAASTTSGVATTSSGIVGAKT